MKKSLILLLTSTLTLSMLAGCVSAPEGTTTTDSSSTTTASDEDLVEIKFNLAFGNKSRTMTYNQNTPLTLSDGSVVTAGMLKPVWDYVQDAVGAIFTDVTVQDATASEMMATASTTNFTDACIYGGEYASEDIMNYGAEGKFVALNDMIDQGLMPNFGAYLEENPTIKSAITAYDGNIYHVPYVAEINNPSRQFVAREAWPVTLLDGDNIAYDTDVEITIYYDGFYVDGNERVDDNGGVVTPMEGVEITKKTDENIIEIQNALAVKNGETLTTALVEYIERNYDYENASELYNGAYAAYDIDELVALFRCIKANPTLLTDGAASTVWPFFVRQSEYREDLLRLSTYFDGQRVHGADSYTVRWEFNEDGTLNYTYDDEEIYEVLNYLSDLNAEGLIYSDVYDTTNTDSFRSTLWGTDTATENPSFGYMSFDWIASSTAPTLNGDIVAVLPPVAEINGVWQYYIDNTRTVKPDGWGISVAGTTEEQLVKACEVLDYYFTEEGNLVQNYGLPMDISETEVYVGPDGNEYPLFEDWVLETCSANANGDLSVFFRDWMGSLMPIGYQKEIGFEYQNTSDLGFAAWELVNNSTINYPSYAGTGEAGDNDYFYTLTPTVFSLTERQTDTVSTQTKIDTEATEEYVFNVIRYATLGNAPAGTSVPTSYEEYQAYFIDAGLELYEQTYNDAYAIMSGSN